MIMCDTERRSKIPILCGFIYSFVRPSFITALLLGVFGIIEPTVGFADESFRGTVTPPGTQAIAPYHGLTNNDLLALFMKLNVQDPNNSPEHHKMLNDLLKEIRQRKLEGELRRRQPPTISPKPPTSSRRP
jgi:hypothetical protein